MTPGNLVNHHLHDYICEKVAQGVDGVGTLCEKKNGRAALGEWRKQELNTWCHLLKVTHHPTSHVTPTDL